MAKTTYQQQRAGSQGAFGYAARESSGTVLQTATRFTTQDAAGSPLNSPLAYSNASTITLAIPDPAVQIILCPSTDLRVSEDATMSHYDIVAAGTKEAFAVALMQNAYIRGDTTSGTVRFRFVQV